MSIPVLHADPALLAVDKPTGLASIPERDPAADSLLARLTAEHGPLFVVHRLDKDVSGVLVFARTAGAHRALCRQFEARRVSKTYLALVHGEVRGEAGRIDAPLRTFGSGRTGVDAARGKPSVTSWRVLARRPGSTLLEVQPLTGRRHQIRAHLCSIGHPIAGGTRYDARPDADGSVRIASRAADDAQSPLPRLMLHALELEVDHPATGARLRLVAPAPAAFDLPRNGSVAG